jgi:hypothetical protein
VRFSYQLVLSALIPIAILAAAVRLESSQQQKPSAQDVARGKYLVEEGCKMLRMSHAA